MCRKRWMCSHCYCFIPPICISCSQIIYYNCIISLIVSLRKYVWFRQLTSSYILLNLTFVLSSFPFGLDVCVVQPLFWAICFCCPAFIWAILLCCPAFMWARRLCCSAFIWKRRLCCSVFFWAILLSCPVFIWSWR